MRNPVLANMRDYRDPAGARAPRDEQFRVVGFIVRWTPRSTCGKIALQGGGSMTKAADFLIAFQGVDVATANGLAADLEDFLSESVPDADIERRREDPLTQDFGATLAIIVGSAAVTALAKGVASWLARRQDARLVLKSVDIDGQVHEVQVDGQLGWRTERVLSEFFKP
jgi:hypothetical protein